MKQTSLLRKLWLPLVLVAACMHLAAQGDGWIRFGETRVLLDSNTDNLAGEGWKWDFDSKTLTLNSTYTKGYIHINNAEAYDINLVYSGDVTINGDGFAAINCTNGNLTIDREEGDDGTLTLSSRGNSSLRVGEEGEGNLTIRGGTINTSTTRDYGSGLDADKGNIVITGDADITASGTGREGNGIKAQSGTVTLSTSGTVKTVGSLSGIYGGRGTHITSGTVTVGNAGSLKGHVQGPLTVSGADTKVTVNGSIRGGGLTLNGGTVVVTGKIDGDVTLNGGTLNPTGNAGIASGGISLSIVNCQFEQCALRPASVHTNRQSIYQPYAARREHNRLPAWRRLHCPCRGGDN